MINIYTCYKCAICTNNECIFVSFANSNTPVLSVQSNHQINEVHKIGGIHMAADVYKMVTDRIIAELEKGTIPWEKPWTRTRSEPITGSQKNRILY